MHTSNYCSTEKFYLGYKFIQTFWASKNNLLKTTVLANRYTNYSPIWLLVHSASTYTSREELALPRCAILLCSEWNSRKSRNAFLRPEVMMFTRINKYMCTKLVSPEFCHVVNTIYADGDVETIWLADRKHPGFFHVLFLYLPI